MPKALNIDWTVAKALYLQGYTLGDVARDLGITEGAIRQRSTRYKWKAEKDELSKRVVTNLADRKESWRLKAQNVADRLIHVLESMPDSRLAAFKRPDIQNAKDVIDVGMRAYGLDKDQGGVKVNIGVYTGGECIRNVSGGEGKPTQTVDIQASVED